MSAKLKIYDNGASLETGISDESRNVYFEIQYDNDNGSSIAVELDNEELEELIMFLQSKKENLLLKKGTVHTDKN